MAARRKNPESSTEALCVYGCGRPSEGTLMVSFTPHRRGERDYSHERGFSAYLPTCNACVRGAVQVRVQVPPDPNNG